jgi:SNF2 family DNA or RNA helicase
VLYVSLRAGGVGLNLQAGSTVVMFDRWWNPAVEEQAIQRAHRFGRDRPLYVIKFQVVNSIEERIAEVLRDKRVTIDEYTEGQTTPRYAASLATSCCGSSTSARCGRSPGSSLAGG